jgi:hypothetical protein
MGVTIREKDSGTVLAEAEVGPGPAKYEGNPPGGLVAAHASTRDMTGDPRKVSRQAS